jgi:hypothetical protein
VRVFGGGSAGRDGRVWGLWRRRVQPPWQHSERREKEKKKNEEDERSERRENVSVFF